MTKQRWHPESWSRPELENSIYSTMTHLSSCYGEQDKVAEIYAEWQEDRGLVNSAVIFNKLDEALQICQEARFGLAK